MNKGGFSWKKLSGYSGVKSNFSKKLGVPLTKSGRNQKIGRIVSKGCLGLILIIIIPLTFVLFLSCLSDKKNNEDSIKPKFHNRELPKEFYKEKEIPIKPKENFKPKFAGSYTIETKGYPSYKYIEVYALNENGKASWLYIFNDGKGGVNVKSEKSGYWVADKKGITVIINGNTGVISETYTLKNNVLTNIENSERSLKKT
jgi:hypothetical protein